MSASRTALIAAAARAQHLRVDDPPPIVEDTVAELLLGDDADTMLGLLGSLPEEEVLALRAAIMARCRVSEDRARAAASRGAARYVLLGAGLDSAAWRLCDLDLEVVEIDQAEVLDDKRARAAAAGLVSPERVRYLPADLAVELADELLERAVESADRMTVISWCGVTQYLPREAVLATLRAVAGLPSGTEVVFTTVLPDESVPEDLRRGLQRSAEIAAAAGEPWVTRLTTEDTAAVISEAGLELVADMGATELNVRLFSDRSDGLSAVEAERVIIAAVG